jgi:uncharacterized protein with ParB-like and HNH nuclease domain
MQQQFETVNTSIKEISGWNEKDELVLQPRFQRRDVWSDKARSYLIDTIVRGKPIPKLYMRMIINPRTKRIAREIVDGQQRLKSVLMFLDDAFKISRTHNEKYGGKYFSDMDDDIKEDILNYRFAIDVLEETPDEEVHDIFARLNTYSTTLNYQELRHAKYFGEFRASTYSLAYEFIPFWIKNNIFSDKRCAVIDRSVSPPQAEEIRGISLGHSISLLSKEDRSTQHIVKVENEKNCPHRCSARPA